MQLRLTKILFIAVLTTAMSAITGCDFLEIQPPADEISSETAFDDPGTIEALVNDMYRNAGEAYENVFWRTDLAADDTEFYSLPDIFDYIATNTYDAEDSEPAFWSIAYSVIYTANMLLDKLPEATVLSDKTRRQYLAEAHFMRAYCYFYLVNLYGDVPLVQATNPGQSISKPRTPAEDVWGAVLDDLNQALDLAPADFDNSGRANRWAIRSLLARIHLYRENWSQSESLATEVIENSPFSLNMDLGELFATDSPETIFAPPLSSFGYTIVSFLSDKYTPGLFSDNPTIVLRSGLINAFEPGDNRLDMWTGTHEGDRYPYKYINPGLFAPVLRPEYLQHIRLAELYLIRAEARARQGNVTGSGSAESDLNKIRTRAGLDGTKAATQADMVDAIMHERRIELFTEGQRWFDLKRTGRMDTVLGALKNTWEPYKKLFPIPQQQIDTNPNFEQNPGW